MIHFIVFLIVISIITYALGSFFFAAAGFFGLSTLLIALLFVGLAKS